MIRTHRISSLKRATAVVVGGMLAWLPSCSPSSPSRTAASQTSSADAEQRIIDESTTALEALRSNPDFSELAASLKNASGVFVFPHVRKAAFILGGQGGNGVLLARDDQGNWSPPAFYSIGAGSVGLQLGYEDASIVLVLMNHGALESALDKGLTLGANVSVAGGTLGNSSETRAVDTATDIRQFVDASGVFAGASLDGAVIGSRRGKNHDYYGEEVSAHDILMARTVAAPHATKLEHALSAMSSSRGPVAAR